ncbi:MAG: hypothetical protein K6G62_03100 [Eubacterium sp.]|nr:hypothetical protein [Eubacterium sp.]
MGIQRIAHRGFSSQAPENSGAAFALAAEGDFFGVECDIWKTLDGRYVVAHDKDLNRMFGVDFRIPDRTWEEIRNLPMVRGACLTKHPPQHLILLEDYLAYMSRSDRTHPIIELKMEYTAVELREIVNLVRSYQLYDRCFFISLHPQVLLRLRDELDFPRERLQYVYGATPASKYMPVGDGLERWLQEEGISLDSRYQLLTRGTVLRLHEAGLKVNVWTVNKQEEFNRMLDYGVDYITSNYYLKER